MIVQGKVVLLTGATKGIGKAIFKRFLEEGAHIVGIYSSDDQAALDLQKELNLDQKGKSYLIKGSVVDRTFIRDTIAQVVNTHGSIDVLINNAGVTNDQFLINMKEEQWSNVYHVNFLGTHVCTTEALPFMKSQKSGSIINVVSTTGVIGREAQSNYGASKGSIMGLTRLLSRKYACDGIRINCIAPGMINTSMIHHVPENKIDNFLHFTNGKRLGSPEEVANTAVFLASDFSNYFNDTVLKVDGGFLR
ncbi:SDR family NAD(P)-dependent oxidoreductase [Shouchella patagoniensis]|uniref:SDR family NAD(P)-dependent oxidoreductase n=1 Tax=Shouchella patagoniensis TaxID=228576 RepID=UPI0009957C87|nr:SDR family NAD(P)-dependent oxidoreductase [Shouchella patagoniensis]